MSRRNLHDDSFDLRWLRSAIDLAICFVIAVILLRTFILEGYLISTGSMAPGLLGFHRRIACPSCRYDFAFGVAFDDSVDSDAPSINEPEGSRRYATCPNCGQIDIDVSGVPNSHGDQLLVQKHVYDLRTPERWEVVVFRNPASPGEAYVKRVTGLPGDRIQIINGDIFINGKIARKNFEQQLAMRIPACNIHYLADDDDWQLPWELDDGWSAADGILVTGAVDASASTAMAPSVVWPSAAAWVSAQSTNSAPTTMLLTFTPQALINELVNATLELTAADAVGEQVRRVPLTLLCTQGQSYLPLIAAQ